MIVGVPGFSMEPPPPFRLTSPEVLELREGGGGAALFGLPFFLAGCAICFNVLRAVILRAAWDGLPSLGFAGMGLAFTVIGAVLMFGRRWTVVDLTSGVLVRSYGMLVVPLRTQQRLLSEFNAVALAYDPGDSDRAECFPVRLRSITGAHFVVRSPGTFADSRVLAEYLSDFLRFPLVDMISDHERVAVPGHNSLRERVVAGATEVTQPERPVNMRCRVMDSGGKTTIVIPSGSGPLSHLLGIVLPLAVFLFVIPGALRFLTRPETSPLTRFGLVLLLTVLFVPPLIFLSVTLMVGGVRKHTTVIASRAGLEIEQASGWRKRNKLIPAAELLDVDSSTVDGAIQSIRAAANVPSDTISDSARWIQVLKRWVPNKGIVIKARTELITVGEGLPAGELQYLRWVLRKALTA